MSNQVSRLTKINMKRLKKISNFIPLNKGFEDTDFYYNNA